MPIQRADQKSAGTPATGAPAPQLCEGLFSARTTVASPARDWLLKYCVVQVPISYPVLKSLGESDRRLQLTKMYASCVISW